MEERTIELVYFEGCPNAGAARSNLRSALGAAENAAPWREWDLSDDATPERLRRFGSPTVLVDGEDVTGKGGAGSGGVSCRSDGAPDAATIRRALRAAG